VRHLHFVSSAESLHQPRRAVQIVRNNFPNLGLLLWVTSAALVRGPARSCLSQAPES